MTFRQGSRPALGWPAKGLNSTTEPETTMHMRTHRTGSYGLVLLAGLGLGILVGHSLGPARPRENLALPDPGRSGSVGRSAEPAPWGRLEVTEFLLPPPEELLAGLTATGRRLPWHFPGASLEAVSNLLGACGLGAAGVATTLEGADADYLLPSSASRTTHLPLADLIPAGVRVLPPAEVVLALSPAGRQRLYAVLGQSELNRGQRFPVRLPPREFEARVAPLRLPPAKLAQLRRLVYTNGGTLCLADVESLRGFWQAEEVGGLMQVLHQTPTLLVRLELPAGTQELERLVRYWGRHGRGHRIKPLLKGLASARGRPRVSITSLLPAFARSRLYTFPEPATPPTDPRQHSLWTALNFFNEEQESRYLEKQYAEQVLHSEYEPTGLPPAFGDLIGLATPTGELIHVGVYIASDVVFTEGGAGPLEPWVLMRIPEMMRLFRPVETVEAVTYRHKGA